MEMNYIIVINKDDVKAENYIKSFEILDRFLKVEMLNGNFTFINIDIIRTFHVMHKDN